LFGEQQFDDLGGARQAAGGVSMRSMLRSFPVSSQCLSFAFYPFRPRESGEPRPVIQTVIVCSGFRLSRMSENGLEGVEDFLDMLDIGRRSEAVADQLAPFLEVGGVAKILGVVFSVSQFHEQPVALRLLVRFLQCLPVQPLAA